MSDFKVGDKVCRTGDNCAGVITGGIYTVKGFRMGGTAIMLLEFPEDKRGWDAIEFVLVRDHVLTPEEVFEHLRKGTELQHLVGTYGWKDVTTPEELYYTDICSEQFRIKPVPEIIEANGRKYKLIEE